MRADSLRVGLRLRFAQTAAPGDIPQTPPAHRHHADSDTNRKYEFQADFDGD